ncbi:MAG: type II and III secretion system protein [Crocinitomicaceae bacterium]|nr:type II and III secretion system protein [Crocinitomicaceae bacterium]
MRIIVLIIALALTGLSIGQNFSEETLRAQLDSVSMNHPGLNNKLQLNVNSLQLSELVNSVALENNLNISIDPGLNQQISYNFYDAQVKDMLVFIYLNFPVEIDFVGSIISVRKRKKKSPSKPLPKLLDVKYNPSNKFLSLNLKNDTLWRVAEELTKATNENYVVDPLIRKNVVNAYFMNRPSEQVLEMFAQANGLEVIKETDFFRIKSKPEDKENPQNIGRGKKKGSKYQPSNANGDFTLVKNNVGALDIFAQNVQLADLIQAAAQESGVNYIVFSALKGTANLDVKDIRFEELVEKVFKGTTYSMKVDNDVYLIGENKQDGLRITEMVRLENRTIESVKAAIPNELTTGIEVLEFIELNGLILTGGKDKVDQLKRFIASIDLVVPMVQIDVMILFSSKSAGINTGIAAGVKDEPTPTQGTLLPGVDLSLGAQSINSILQAINGFGVVNLGQVASNFYVSLSAMEENGIVDIESTPKISTLNGHEATISIGQTTHYQQTQINVTTSIQNQGVYQSDTWKPIDANLNVTIKPFVSSDEHVTLTVSVEQNDFSGQSGTTAPPDLTTRSFKSMIRVKNGEMILLGGLEEKEKKDIGSGIPILSRIPILKWFFSSKTKSKEKSKLHILIRPVVTY